MSLKRYVLLCYFIFFSGIVFGQFATDGVSKQIEGYDVSGQITGNYLGKVFLVKEDGMHGPQTVVDSCDVKDGRFHFSADKAPEHSVIWFIRSQDGQLAPIFLESGYIRTTMRADYFLGANTKGTINNNLWNLHQLHVKYQTDSMLLASNTEYMRYGRGTPEEEDWKFRTRTDAANSSKLNMEKKMVKDYNDQAFAPFIMLFEMTHELSLDELKELRDQLGENLSDHPYVLALDEVIANKEFKVGMDAPSFKIMGMDGKEIELKDYYGKYVLLDFWASWCGPCRREMPNVVKLYQECKDKNFEIIGISLDQKEDDWKKAVDELGMTWPQACDFQVWYGAVARKYNLSAVPYTVLINPEGKVEAIDLRGEELINRVKKILK